MNSRIFFLFLIDQNFWSKFFMWNFCLKAMVTNFWFKLRGTFYHRFLMLQWKIVDAHIIAQNKFEKWGKKNDLFLLFRTRLQVMWGYCIVTDGWPGEYTSPPLTQNRAYKQTGQLQFFSTDNLVHCQIFTNFLVAVTQLNKKHCPSACPSIGLLVRPWARVKKWGHKRFRSFLCMCLC